MHRVLLIAFLLPVAVGAQNARPQGSADPMADCSKSPATVLLVTFDDLKVRVYGDVGIVTGVYAHKATLNDKDATGTGRFTDVFVKRTGRWQLVSTQSTRVAKK